MITESCGASYKGNVRGHNEDNIYVDGSFRNNLSVDVCMIESEREGELHTFAVFDGMGGEARGEKASLIAAEVLADNENADANSDIDIDAYIAEANKSILKEAAYVAAHGMGTTAAILVIRDDIATAYNVGDSRVYLFRNRELTQMSRDHSVVQTMVDLGFISDEARYTNPHSGELTQYIGMSSEDGYEPEASRSETQVNEGDIFLLCSDGLNAELSDAELSSILDKYGELQPDKIATELIMTAKERVCSDNVSAIIVKCR